MTVPVLLTDTSAIFDSFAIAKHAEALGAEERLFPPGLGSDIEAWNETSEAALAVGRKLALVRSLTNAEAQKDGLDGVVPEALRGAFRPLATSAIRFIATKYGANDLDAAALEDGLAKLRSTLAKNGEYVLGRFTYADVTTAVMLQCVLPPDRIPMSPSIRATFTDYALAERYADLIAWRDHVYAKHRR